MSKSTRSLNCKGRLQEVIMVGNTQHRRRCDAKEVLSQTKSRSPTLVYFPPLLGRPKVQIATDSTNWRGKTFSWCPFHPLLPPNMYAECALSARHNEVVNQWMKCAALPPGSCRRAVEATTVEQSRIKEEVRR